MEDNCNLHDKIRQGNPYGLRKVRSKRVLLADIFYPIT